MSMSWALYVYLMHLAGIHWRFSSEVFTPLKLSNELNKIGSFSLLALSNLNI